MVSVIIPTYNRADSVVRAVKSVIQGSYTDIEVLVIDDASNDGTQERIRQLKDERIKYFALPENRGGSAARNEGLSRALGEYIAFLDSDDKWLPHKLEEQLKLMAGSKRSYGAVYSGFYAVDAKGRFLYKTIAGKEGDLSEELLVTNCIGTLSTVVFRKDILQRLNGFDTELKSCQDWDLYIRAAGICRFTCVPQLLVEYRGGYGFERTSIAREAVIAGQKRLADKYRTEIAGLTLKQRARRSNYTGRMLIAGGAYAAGWKNILAGFVLSFNAVYLIRGIIFSVKTLYRRRTSREV